MEEREPGLRESLSRRGVGIVSVLITAKAALPEEDKACDDTESDRDGGDEYVVVLEDGNDGQAAGRDDEYAPHK